MAEEFFQSMAQSIVDGDAEQAAALARRAVDTGIDPLTALNEGFVVGVDRVGAAFACGEAFLPELVMAGEAMQAATAALEPEMRRRGAERATLGKVVLATVEGDIHEIGKSLVGTLLSSSGFEVFDLGVDAGAHKIIAEALRVEADIIAMSAMLTTTMVKQHELIEELEQEGLRDRFKVMVGGSPVTRDWVGKIGADGYAEDAIGAVDVARSLMGAQ